MWRNYLEANDCCHYIRCSIEAFLPSHLQKTQECRAIDGLSHSLASTCGHMWPPSKGCLDRTHGALELRCGLLVGLTLQVAEHQGQAVSLRQAIQLRLEHR